MAPRKERGRKKRKATAGSFKPGPDPRRHRFTPSDCRVGWWVANILHPELREWLRMRLYVFYSSRKQPQDPEVRSLKEREVHCHDEKDEGRGDGSNGSPTAVGAGAVPW